MKHLVKVLCPQCHSQIGLGRQLLDVCRKCGHNINKIHGIPVLRTNEDNEQIDLTETADQLTTYNSAVLDIEFVKNAVNSGKLVLELGAGLDICDAENLVKTDAYVYSDELDYVADAHNLPFSANSFDYIFSLAVFEHLHTPWKAAEEIHRVLKPGGQVFTLCAFNQHIHAYPHHYFNMTDMALRRIFSHFDVLECEPSRNAHLACIAASLCDLRQLSTGLISRLNKNTEKMEKAVALDKSIETTINILPELQHDLISNLDEERYEAWKRIAPGFYIIAAKTNNR